MKKIFEIFVFLLFISCATFKEEPVLVGERIFGKGRLYLYENNNFDYLDFLFFYGNKRLKIEGLSVVGTPLFQIYISEITYMIVPKSKSYWEGNLVELTKFFLKKEISEDEILSIFLKGNSTSLEIKEFLKNSNFPKEICWKGEGLEGKVKIKWVKRSHGLNIDLKIPPFFRKVSLEEVSI